MKRSRFNLLSAVVGFAACLAWLAAAQTATAAVWLSCSIVWLLLAMFGSRAQTPRPAAQLARRLSRLLIWS